jgi:quercetin dioxygenase-like cupin family protein
MEIRSTSDVPEAPGTLATKERNGMRAWWIAGREATNATMGCFAIVELAPGAGEGLRRYNGSEAAVFAIEGTVLCRGTGEESVRLREWDAVYVRPGRWHSFRNDADRPARLAMILGGAANPEEAGREELAPGATEDAVPAELRKHEAPGLIPTTDYGGLPEAYGLRRAGDEWYFGEESVGAKNLQVRVTRFEAGAGHFGLHRHSRAEEFFYVLGGGGFQLSRSGETPVGEGELVFTPAGEEHGWRNGPDEESFVLAGWFGASSPEGSGYEQTVLADGTEANG